MAKYDLSIILPVYNEAKVIERVVKDFDNKVIRKFKGNIRAQLCLKLLNRFQTDT